MSICIQKQYWDIGYSNFSLGYSTERRYQKQFVSSVGADFYGVVHTLNKKPQLDNPHHKDPMRIISGMCNVLIKKCVIPLRQRNKVAVMLQSKEMS